MSTITLNYNLIAGVVPATQYGIFGYDSIACLGYGNANSKLRIFKNSMPTKSDLNAVTNVSTFRTTDLLITYTLGQIWSGSGTMYVVSNTPFPTAAVASGTASWFLLSNVETGNIMLAAGNITLPGGGGELTISNLDIVSGTVYSLGTLTFGIPTTYTYP